jgi:IS5 family transposase
MKQCPPPPEQMHQTKKGNARHFCMAAHISAGADSGLVHSLRAMATGESDVAHNYAVLHAEQTMAFLGAGYTGVACTSAKRSCRRRPNKIRSDIEWSAARWRKEITKTAEGTTKTFTNALERVKAQTRARAARPYRSKSPPPPIGYGEADGRAGGARHDKP